jgi:hypothetical protein
VKNVKVVVTGHYFADAINRQVNKPAGGEASQPAEQSQKQQLEQS